MTVHFIGTGPGAVDLLTLRGHKILSECPICLYAGSIVPKEMLDFCPPNATLIDTAPLNLDQIEAEYVKAHQAGQDIARLHSGDLSVYSAVSEQIRRLKKHNIPYTLTPGVPAFAAAAALIEKELTIPEVAQSVVLTRISGRASTMPENEKLETFAKTGCTLLLHLAIHRLEEIVERLIPFYGTDCPIVIAARVTWENEQILKGTLGTITEQFNQQPVERTALIMVGLALNDTQVTESALYNIDYQRRFKIR
ncbi:Precorrin-4 methylase (CobM) (PDB:4E16) [Commensalibacter communis]|uniref:precorrin-4 C(11)-methyltransferase n=1 Tax=Commensalibacter communis TaxID=2972786 RepID=UPI0022FFA341|nr:precorrin-4 C(11)-methyltransferase [Commensalibacter communis]CAI3923849.1 Precorrin-4 methylase (CobM) (PDB:4E16) [Commensalibacter communis]CAI3935553.1 Precorrin-4 methylase (CobM) (PDB:4E16) [Commensalibacter communis]